MPWIAAYIGSAVTFLALDALWLGVVAQDRTEAVFAYVQLASSPTEVPPPVRLAPHLRPHPPAVTRRKTC